MNVNSSELMEWSHGIDSYPGSQDHATGAPYFHMQQLNFPAIIE